MNGQENLEGKLLRKRKSDFRWEYREIQAGRLYRMDVIKRA